MVVRREKSREGEVSRAYSRSFVSSSRQKWVFLFSNFAIFCDTFFVVIFRKNACFLVNRKRDVLDSHQIKESVYYLSLDSKRNDGNSQKPVGFSMDETSTRDALKAFVNREMSSVAVRSVVVIVFFSIARDLNLLNID